jgi:hypothetical protein
VRALGPGITAGLACFPMARRSLRQRLGSSVAELERTRLQKRFDGLDLTPLSDVALRRPIRIGGEISRIVIAPRRGVPTLEVMVTDGTGAITAVFTGRRRIAGLEHGRAVILEGVATREADRLIVFNPAYTLVA